MKTLWFMYFLAALYKPQMDGLPSVIFTCMKKLTVVKRW